MEKFTVYSKENCQPCKATYRKLDKEGIDYDTVHLEEHPELAEAFRSEGLMEAPVVDTGIEKWSGFRPDKIGEYALKMANIEKPQE